MRGDHGEVVQLLQRMGGRIYKSSEKRLVELSKSQVAGCARRRARLHRPPPASKLRLPQQDRRALPWPGRACNRHEVAGSAATPSGCGHGALAGRMRNNPPLHFAQNDYSDVGGRGRYVRMYEGEKESSMQPEWEIDPADLVIGVKVRLPACDSAGPDLSVMGVKQSPGPGPGLASAALRASASVATTGSAECAVAEAQA